MTAGTIDRLQTAPSAPSARTPSTAPMERIACNIGKPAGLIEVLNDLGLTVPLTLSAAASSGRTLQDLQATRHRYAMREVDAALAETKLSMQDRLRIKVSMRHAGLID